MKFMYIMKFKKYYPHLLLFSFILIVIIFKQNQILSKYTVNNNSLNFDAAKIHPASIIMVRK